MGILEPARRIVSLTLQEALAPYPPLGGLPSAMGDLEFYKFGHLPPRDFMVVQSLVAGTCGLWSTTLTLTLGGESACGPVTRDLPATLSPGRLLDLSGSPSPRTRFRGGVFPATGVGSGRSVDPASLILFLLEPSESTSRKEHVLEPFNRFAHDLVSSYNLL